MKNKILLLLKLPPPLTGATLINQYVTESELIKSCFEVKTIKISYKDSIDDKRIFSFRKICNIILTFIRLLKSLIFFRPLQIYFQVSPVGIAFFRDCLYIFLIKFFRKPIIYHLHGRGILEYTENFFLKTKIYKWAFRNSTVICLSNLLTYDIQNIYKGKPYILPNAITIHLTIKQIKKTSTINILFLSNIILSKGILDFLDAIELLFQSQTVKNDFRAYIVGKEVDLDRTKLNEHIIDRGLNNIVVYLGAKYDEDKYEIINKSNIFVHPTLNECFPLVLLEAMQSGLPVVSTYEGAIPEIIDDGITGFIVEKQNPQQIAEKLEILINNPELRKKMGEAGRKKFLENYTIDKFEENLVNVFNQILEKQ